MKIVRASRAKGPSNRAEAWACFTANLALPGSGSLAAGKSIGYAQLALAAVGFIVSVVTGIRLLQFQLTGTGITPPTDDPLASLTVLWQVIRWPLAGLGIFGVSLVWAILTSLQILAAHPKTPTPPRIT